MKLLARCLCAALLVFTLAGCEDDPSATSGADATPTKDGRPAGFEDMMKGMEKDMKKATANPTKLAKPAN